MKTHINGVPVDRLAEAYELITLGAIPKLVAAHMGINYDRLKKALWLAKTKGVCDA